MTTKLTTAMAPASIGNVSLGFDVLGAAIAPVDGTPLGDEVSVTSAEQFSLSVHGRFADRLPGNADDNIVTRCYHHFIDALKQRGIAPAPVAMTLAKHLPIGSGLGSSASSIVAAFAALNDHFDQPFSSNELLFMMGELEGQISGSVHYDNVAPCFLGGMTLMTGHDNPITASLPVIENWYWVVCYSGISVSTAAARKLVPQSLDLATSLTFGRQLGLFVHALHSGDEQLAASVMQDVIAEPHRKALLPEFDRVKQLCFEQGALAFGISGSGPTVFAVSDQAEQAQAIAELMRTNYIQNDDGFCHVCKIHTHGTRCESTS